VFLLAKNSSSSTTDRQTSCAGAAKEGRKFRKFHRLGLGWIANEQHDGHLKRQFSSCVGEAFSIGPQDRLGWRHQSIIIIIVMTIIIINISLFIQYYHQYANYSEWVIIEFIFKWIKSFNVIHCYHQYANDPKWVIIQLI